ncbi:MAG: Transcriptional regulator, GntR family [uncultured Nocardioidaceae bacterium]|uniref:Transcriptional regulator, GntR family n=1 Tax=uncultured Nocardioidaceae bacterium TaxID=253824 RepID=A0A6J4MXC0_9ACTN|nr:MAG: Transcriptional regulator, GntR family [uncultured Nocardioidaceae bacterium]
MVLISLDDDSTVPPYEQVRTQVASQVTDGRLPAGTRLPTVRQLAGDLGLAVNTVARAYRELESDGVIVTEGRRGTFVRSGAAAPSAVDELAGRFVAAARAHGLTRAEAVRLVEGAWPVQ